MHDGHAAARIDEPAPGYRHALQRLYALGPGRMLPGRERLRELLEHAGNPQLKVATVLVGGTNGKGRLVTALSAVLSQRFMTGAFVKPHLKSIRERWRLQDKPVSAELFIEYTNRACDLIDGFGEPISFFEANVLLGALLFEAQGCDLAVWEVGLGGRHDACNLVAPLLSVITNVQFDHQAILGNTLAEIAADKAHIARSVRPLLLGPPRAGWEATYEDYAPVIRQVAGQLGARMVEPQPDDYRPLGLLPADTNTLLQASLEQLAQSGWAVNAGDVLQGLRTMHYRGRMEQLELAGTTAFVDAAHNPDSMRWLAHELAAEGGKFPVIFGCQTTRDPREMLEPLAPSISQLIPIAVPVLHPCSVNAIIAAAEGLGISISLPPGFVPRDAPADLPLDRVTELDPPDNSTGWIECMRHAAALSREQQRPLVVCGSIYYIGEILRAFEDGWVQAD